jgi:hypothetical protein
VGTPSDSVDTCRITVVERSGNSWVPSEKPFSADRFCGAATSANAASDAWLTTGAPV